MPFKAKEEQAAPATSEPEAVIAATVERTVQASATGPAPAYFTILVDGLVAAPPKNRRGIGGRQYSKGQFYAADNFLTHQWKRNPGTVAPYTGDPTVHKIPLHATPDAPYEYTEIETEEAPDLFTGEEEG